MRSSRGRGRPNLRGSLREENSQTKACEADPHTAMGSRVDALLLSPSSVVAEGVCLCQNSRAHEGWYTYSCPTTPPPTQRQQ